MKKKLNILILLLCAFTALVRAQTHEAQDSHEKMWRGALMMANAHVPTQVPSQKYFSVFPAYGADVDYFFHKHWSVAAQGHVILQNYTVHDGHGSLERTYPVSVALAMHYHFVKHWSMYLGPGYEIDKHQDLFLLKLGTEYSFEVTPDFEIGINLMYENKWEIYDSWMFGIAFNKRLGTGKKH